MVFIIGNAGFCLVFKLSTKGNQHLLNCNSAVLQNKKKTKSKMAAFCKKYIFKHKLTWSKDTLVSLIFRILIPLRIFFKFTQVFSRPTRFHRTGVWFWRGPRQLESSCLFGDLQHEQKQNHLLRSASFMAATWSCSTKP